MVRPIGHIIGQAQVGVALDVGPTKEAAGCDVVHFRWQSVDDGFIREPNGLVGGERDERTGRRDLPGVINPEGREFIGGQPGSNSPGGVVCGAGTAQSQEPVRVPMIAIYEGGAADPKGIDQFTGLTCTVYEVLL